MCKNFEGWREKGRSQDVVRTKCGRGPMTTTRSGGLVDRSLGSCLESIADVGKNVKGDGSREGLKRWDIDQKGRG